MRNLLPDVTFGGGPTPFSKVDDTDDDEVLTETPRDVVSILGFDPLDLDLAEDAKLDKSEVAFEHPAVGPHHCAECAHYEGAPDCALVAGVVEPDDWCELFEETSHAGDITAERTNE